MDCGKPTRGYVSNRIPFGCHDWKKGGNIIIMLPKNTNPRPLWKLLYYLISRGNYFHMLPSGPGDDHLFSQSMWYLRILQAKNWKLVLEQSIWYCHDSASVGVPFPKTPQALNSVGIKISCYRTIGHTGDALQLHPEVLWDVRRPCTNSPLLKRTVWGFWDPVKKTGSVSQKVSQMWQECTSSCIQEVRLLKNCR